MFLRFNVNTGNLNSRGNPLKSQTGSFSYDAVGLDRLTSVTGPSAMSVSYGSNGNILTKSDASTGTYAYSNTPYAVSSITGAQNISTTLQDIDYCSFEKVKKITEGTKTSDFVYNADQQRVRMILKDNGETTAGCVGKIAALLKVSKTVSPRWLKKSIIFVALNQNWLQKNTKTS
ncbi:MAG: hypothetical protein PHI28_16330 [Mangrovibacterium sp.]|nr:hypothetical protein [Mangrovibacterium sp.]